jgi:photosystem II stability/assembly factor-like uncharacterized protein
MNWRSNPVATSRFPAPTEHSPFPRAVQRRCVVALVLALIAGALVPLASAQSSALRWAGLVHEAFTLDGEEVWTVEDGGRIRHRFLDPASPTGYTWEFQSTPGVVEDSLRRVFFLADGLHGWAVGQNGWVLRTTDGGGTWSVFHRQPAAIGAGWEDLWDVYALSPSEGFFVGLHGIWWWAPGVDFVPATFLDATGAVINKSTLELYSIDIKTGPGGYGLACGQPGIVFKQDAANPVLWREAFNILDLCVPHGQPPILPTCAQDAICPSRLRFEMWDVEISRHASEPLALAVGGIGTNCGVVIASTDDGATWSVEPHECRCMTSGCTACNGHPEYTDNGGFNETWRLRSFRELYDIAIFHGDNSAIATGYSGQIVVREPDADPATPLNQPVWRDRSTYSSRQLDSPAAVTLPGFGVASNSGDATNGIGVLTAMGGYIRRTTDGGDTWTNEQDGEPWRVRDVHFVSAADGWMVSQFHRIARTTDGGFTWVGDQSEASLNKADLNSITVAAGGQVGVAVGHPDPSAKWGKVLYNDDLLNQTQWLEPVNVIGVEPSLAVPAQLRDVAWSAGQEFWAVGYDGLVLRSEPTVGLALWIQFVPEFETYASFSDFDLEGVSFSGAAHGVLVGARRPGGVSVGRAYHIDRSSDVTKWFEIPIPNEPNLIGLTDVEFDGTTAYVTGIRAVSGGGRQGVVLKSTLSAGSFTPLVAAAQTFPECSVGESPTSVSVLTQIEIAPGGAIWVGGQCGRLWRSADGASWTPVRSMTDAHIRGMSFPAADTGFVAGHRPNRTGNCIVRVIP